VASGSIAALPDCRKLRLQGFIVSRLEGFKAATAQGSRRPLLSAMLQSCNSALTGVTEG
jgi:hypothetical protein